jgi:LemA protein
MSLISLSLVFWVAIAVSVFWALGAYNRLVNLRADMVRTLQSLAVQWQTNAQAVQNELSILTNASESDSAWGDLGGDFNNGQSLARAVKQFQACLAGVQVKPNVAPPLDDVASIRAAHDVMYEAWQRLHSMHDDLAGPAVPQNLAILWQHHASLAQEKLRDYNACVEAYNRAVGQFPALVLAWIFAFVPAQSL